MDGFVMKRLGSWTARYLVAKMPIVTLYHQSALQVIWAVLCIKKLPHRIDKSGDGKTHSPRTLMRALRKSSHAADDVWVGTFEFRCAT
jgi:hypothetical protein